MKRMAVLTVMAAMLASAGFAKTVSTTAAPRINPAVQSARESGPVSAMQSTEVGNTGSPVIRWEKFYDRRGNPLPGGPPDAVAPDSLYWRQFLSNYLSSSAKEQNPAPANRTAMNFHDGQATPCMAPSGNYVYEVNGTSLYRFSTVDGAMTTYSLSHSGGIGCATDGQYIYVPASDLSKTIYKYTMTGTYVNTTTLDTAADAYAISCVNDTVWACPDRYNHVFYGYAASRFTGGSITADATWDVGTGTNGVGNLAWDGEYYYLAWIGTSPITFKRFYPDRTLYSTGTVSIDPRSVMSKMLYNRTVRQDSLYWKLITSTSSLYSSPKAQNVTAAQPTPLPWQYNQALSCMTPDGHYVFEVNGTDLRRTDLFTGEVDDLTISGVSYGACATDGEYVYVPNGTTTRKYDLDGALLSTTTTDYAPWTGASTFGFGVANDTVWLAPADQGTTWYGYSCSKFTGGSITHDATWTTGASATGTAMTVAWDGRYYYMTWGGYSSSTFRRFYRDRTLYSDGTVTGDARSVMCKAVCPLMVVTTDSQSLHANLAETLRVASGGTLDLIGTHSLDANATFPATRWYEDGCRVILEFSGSPLPTSPALIGDSLAKFVDLGGRVVTAMWADQTGNLAGRYVSRYMPFTIQPQPVVGGTMTTVHDPLHQIMDGVSTLTDSNFITGNTHSTLRSPNCVCLAEWDSDNRVVAAYLDSADVRLVSLGFVPFTRYSGVAGQWAKLLVNAILWVWPGMPAVSVTAPDTGAVWSVGTPHDLTWTAANGPIIRDSLVYSNDGGATWNFVDKYTGSRSSYNWTVPNSPSTDCRVRVFTWNSVGSGFGTSGEFEIRAGSGIEQPEQNGLPLAFALHRARPNPLVAGAQVRYDLPRPVRVELRVYDVTGALVRRLVEGTQTAGYRRAYWNGRDEQGRAVAPGVYYCRLKAGDYVAAQKLVVRR
jgi:hypothetical protein